MNTGKTPAVTSAIGQAIITAADGVVLTGQLWIRNRSAADIKMSSNRSFSETIKQSEGWKKLEFSVTGNGVSNVQFALLAATTGGSVDADVAFLQYEENPYATLWVPGTDDTAATSLIRTIDHNCEKIR
ncbi:MAG: hypothetical protein GX993_06210 [Bacteroidales bacterium]|nr:hypothetical protein [Bacteroidales bacterium]